MRPRHLVSLCLALGACHDSTAPLPQAAFVRLGNGTFHSCGIRKDGVTECWGDNQSFQLGDTLTPAGYSAHPIPVAGAPVFLRVAGGDGHTCALATDSYAYCWGDAAEAGTDSIPPGYEFKPYRAQAGPFVELGARSERVCGLTPGGATYCWGPSAASTLPTSISGNLAFLRIGTGDNGVCGVTAAGAAYCSGDNAFGELGNPSPTPDPANGEFVLVVGSMAWDTVAMGNIHVCGLDRSGAPYCWGDNGYEQLGLDSSVHSSGVPVAVPTTLRFRSITAGAHHTCGLTSSGEAYCWGLDEFGQLGASAPELCYGFGNPAPCSHVPLLVTGGLHFSALDAGSWHTCGLTSGGQIWCWGDDSRGELGDGTVTNSTNPVLVIAGP